MVRARSLAFWSIVLGVGYLPAAVFLLLFVESSDFARLVIAVLYVVGQGASGWLCARGFKLVDRVSAEGRVMSPALLAFPLISLVVPAELNRRTTTYFARRNIDLGLVRPSKRELDAFVARQAMVCGVKDEQRIPGSADNEPVN